MVKEKEQLLEKEEMLLSKYFDEECHFFDRYRVYRLVETKPSAILYLESLESTRRLLRENFEFAPVSLWSRISTRLHQEDKAMLLSGNRSGRKSSAIGFASIFEFIPSFARYGLSGVAVAAVLFMIMPSTKPGTFTKVASTNSSIPTAMEVDWMRTNGRRVTVMPSDEGRAPVIYLKRRALNRTPILERNTQGIIMRDR